MFARGFPIRALVLFAALNALDYFLTWALYQLNDGTIHEANPIAYSCLVSYGWAGLALFKSTTTTIAECAFALVSFHRPHIGRHSLILGCSLMAGVTIYSYCLLTPMIH